MLNPRNTNEWRGRILYTLLTIILLAATLLGLTNYMYNHTEQEAFERLRLETVKLKNTINIQISSDQETLRSMAMLISERYADNDGFEHVCTHFESFGLCENIGILTKDNKLITKRGPVDVQGILDFEEEAKKGEYISGKIKDVTNSEHSVIRSAMPIQDEDGTVIAIMYGTMNVKKMTTRYAEQVKGINGYFCIIEGDSGEFVIDTKNTSLTNITMLANVSFKEGFYYENLLRDITDGNAGYTSFITQEKDQNLYARYSPMDFGNWRIMLAQPESVVFAGTKQTINFFTLASCLIILIMMSYIFFILLSIQKMMNINSSAAEIRRNLLEINQRSEGLYDALKHLTAFSKSRSTFIIDTYDEEYHYILPSEELKAISSKDFSYFNKELLRYAAQHRSTQGADIYISDIRQDASIMYDMPNLYNFMNIHDIQLIKYAVVINNNSNIYVLGVINPKNKMVNDLLKKIAVCFSLAVYNKNHMEITENMALTDSLTGVKNRMSFKQDVKNIHSGKKDFGCIYIDVNELHFYNNKHGHAAGDQMLIFIAHTLKSVFKDSSLYRMGGDEFLILCDGITLDEIKARIAKANAEIEEMKYHIAVGITYGTIENSVEEMINASEKLMYEEKSKYYHHKDLKKSGELPTDNHVTFYTGINELDACMSVMSRRYAAVYCVSLTNDSYARVLASSFFKEIIGESDKFSVSIKKYISDYVKSKHRRSLTSLLDYDILSRQLNDGNIPSVTYERVDGKSITLTIYPVTGYGENIDSIWIFEKDNKNS